MAPTTGPLDIGVYGARGVPSTYSGYETFLSLLLPELVGRGDRVTAYCRTGGEFDDTDWEGVHRKVLPAVPGKNFSTLSHGLVAAAAARAARHDVVLVVNVANAAFCALGRRTGQPVVLNVDGQEWLRGKWGGTAQQVFHRSARIARRCANALVADGVAMAEVYDREFSSPTTVIPYCITTNDWSPDPASVRAAGLEPGKYHLIAGRHNPENNIAEIARLHHDADAELPLVVLGTANYDSPVTAAVAALAASGDRVRMLGHVGDRHAFFDLVHHARLYFHGHSVGGTNPSLVEAMGVGARIVAFDTAFSREVLGDHATYFDLTDASFATAVGTALADDPDVDRKVRDAVRHRAEELYSVDAVVDAYRDLLAAAATTRGPVRIGTMWAP